MRALRRFVEKQRTAVENYSCITAVSQPAEMIPYDRTVCSCVSCAVACFSKSDTWEWTDYESDRLKVH